MALKSVGTAMTWGEALRHTQRLLSDPSSQVGAAVAGWDHAASHEAIAMWNLYDLLHQVAWVFGGKKGPRPKPHPRPTPKAGKRTMKPDETVTTAQAVAALRALGHTAELPSEVSS